MRPIVIRSKFRPPDYCQQWPCPDRFLPDSKRCHMRFTFSSNHRAHEVFVFVHLNHHHEGGLTGVGLRATPREYPDPHSSHRPHLQVHMGPVAKPPRARRRTPRRCSARAAATIVLSLLGREGRTLRCALHPSHRLRSRAIRATIRASPLAGSYGRLDVACRRMGRLAVSLH
jgi:hypothetical protein